LEKAKLALFMMTTITKYSIAILGLLVVILASIVVVDIQKRRAAEMPYTIGSPTVAATSMPPGMVMKTFDVTAGESVPAVSFDITQDSMGGWNVHATTANFTFAPEHLNGEPVAGEGHLHLYVDNNLIIMLGPWYHIDSLTPGLHTIRVGLFNNDHSAYSVNGMHIEEQKEITVPVASGMSM
jgi:hypothetical protein